VSLPAHEKLFEGYQKKLLPNAYPSKFLVSRRRYGENQGNLGFIRVLPRRDAGAALLFRFYHKKNRQG
jgi:hypothetical protein